MYVDRREFSRFFFFFPFFFSLRFSRHLLLSILYNTNCPPVFHSRYKMSVLYYIKCRFHLISQHYLSAYRFVSIIVAMSAIRDNIQTIPATCYPSAVTSPLRVDRSAERARGGRIKTTVLFCPSNLFFRTLSQASSSLGHVIASFHIRATCVSVHARARARAYRCTCVRITFDVTSKQSQKNVTRYLADGSSVEI